MFFFDRINRGRKNARPAALKASEDRGTAFAEGLCLGMVAGMDAKRRRRSRCACPPTANLFFSHLGPRPDGGLLACPGPLPITTRSYSFDCIEVEHFEKKGQDTGKRPRVLNSVRFCLVPPVCQTMNLTGNLVGPLSCDTRVILTLFLARRPPGARKAAAIRPAHPGGRVNHPSA